MTLSTTKLNQSVEKTLRIIEVMTEASSPMHLQDIAKAADIPASTALRMLQTLVNMGYAYQEKAPLKRYGLSLRIVALGQMINDHFPYHDIIHPFLLEISKQTGETCCVSNLQNHMVQYFDVVVGRSNGALTIRQRIGGTAYMHCTASGKMFLIEYTDAQLDDLIATVGLPKLTERTITSKERLVEELDKCRKLGYALDDEEVETGMRCLAAPIRGADGSVVATLSMSGPLSRMPRSRYQDELGPMLVRNARAITRIICGETE